MLEYSWKILHLCDIPGIPEGAPLYLTMQHTERGPFGETMAAESNHDTLAEMVKSASEKGGYVLWMPASTVPKPPKEYRIVRPFICTRHGGCEYEDDGYCVNGPEGCPDRVPYPEISVEEKR